MLSRLGRGDKISNYYSNVTEYFVGNFHFPLAESLSLEWVDSV